MISEPALHYLVCPRAQYRRPAGSATLSIVGPPARSGGSAAVCRAKFAQQLTKTRGSTRQTQPSVPISAWALEEEGRERKRRGDDQRTLVLSKVCEVHEPKKFPSNRVFIGVGSMRISTRSSTAFPLCLYDGLSASVEKNTVQVHFDSMRPGGSAG
ncbi:hypothetical protein PENSPDRAFT_26479 [Peniophora sp. CONT]|nr:hypothetical protein PENSPDRAFT_26479 [Peniophora sp. CONT]